MAMNRGLWLLLLLVELIAVVSKPAFGDDLTVTSFDAYTGQTSIQLQATGNVIFSGGRLNLPALPDGISHGMLTVQAGKDIIIETNTSIVAGPWSVQFLASSNVTLGIGLFSMGDVAIQAGGNLTGLVVCGGTFSSKLGPPPEQVYSRTATNWQMVFLDDQISTTNLTAVAGTNISIFCVPQENPPLSCQWFKDGEMIHDHTYEFNYWMTNLSRTDAGQYSLVSSNAVGRFTNSIRLRVLVPQLLIPAIEPATRHLAVSFRDVNGESPAASDIGNFIVETSTNLVDWTVADLPISTNANGGLLFETIMNCSNSPCFFRVISQ